MDHAKILGKLGRKDEIEALSKESSSICGDPDDFRAELQLSSFLEKCKVDKSSIDGERRIENYGLWNLAGITMISKHSAIFRFTSKDPQRGTPNKRGRDRTVWHRTWHTTLLASVGANRRRSLTMD